MSLAKRQLFERFISSANPGKKSLPDPTVGLTLTLSNGAANVTTLISLTLLFACLGLPPPSPKGAQRGNRERREREKGRWDFKGGYRCHRREEEEREKGRWDFKGGYRYRCRRIEEEEREREIWKSRGGCRCLRHRPEEEERWKSKGVVVAFAITQRKKREKERWGLPLPLSSPRGRRERKRGGFRGGCRRRRRRRRPCSIRSYHFCCYCRCRPYLVHSFCASSTKHPIVEEERG
uniref:Uncharacterized protein n=1 Tax=Nelumbo nucifera TaxID=4432 RepID=A0A822YGG6_NELNU|nr:TPA_asm: hypothetical protein HUJ06_030046 [Nelumbo nucifera]